MLKRYIVVTSPEQKRNLKREDLELATCVNGADGNEFLVYRDNFVAYKIATLTGGQVHPGYIVIDSVTADGDLTLEDGSLLRLQKGEHAPALS